MKTFVWATSSLCCVLLLNACVQCSGAQGPIPAPNNAPPIKGSLQLSPVVNGTVAGGRGLPPSTCPGNETYGAYATAVTLQTDSAGILTGINFTCSDGTLTLDQSGRALPQTGGVQNTTKLQIGFGPDGFNSSTAYVYNGIIGGISFQTSGGSRIQAGITNSSAIPVTFQRPDNVTTGFVVGLQTTFQAPSDLYPAGAYWSDIALAYR